MNFCLQTLSLCQSIFDMTPRHFSIYLIILCAAFSQRIYAQKQGTDYIRLMFYNVENYFDTADDPTTNDNDFTPTGSMRWTQSRYIEKRNNIFRVITNVGEWDSPALVGLCEIENRAVLEIGRASCRERV